ncbi:MAG TPA: hypothetical protein VMY05_00065 [Acidobacteriota bacterium]|nr:hypothetical protein [Acidobacteriota bacterium]
MKRKGRKIDRRPSRSRNYFFVDACFLVNKYIPLSAAPDGNEVDRLRKCKTWWREIASQLRTACARVYVPDVCIAEGFKVLAKKYYQDDWFRTAQEYKSARDRMSRDLRTSVQEIRSVDRRILFHDISTCRDIIIAVDRFFEVFMKHGKKVQIADLILLASAKYLMDFYDVHRADLHIITLDEDLYSGIKLVKELPNAYDPTKGKDAAGRVFR